MTIDEVVLLVKATQPNALTPLQETILRSAWDGKTYTSIASQAHYGEERVRKVASILWQVLGELWQEPITKANFRTVLESRKLTKTQQQLIQDFNRTKTAISLEYPSGPVSLNSRFYIERPPIEERVYGEIKELGSIVCIKSPKKMGKSSLILRIQAEAANLGYRTVTLDFQQADKAIFCSLDKFLRWFCANVSRELQLPLKLNDYWDEDLGSKVSCTIYFQDYLLSAASSPLVLALNEVDWVFEHPEIAEDFLPLLRSWYEQASWMEAWKKLRLVLTYSTEILLPLKLPQSPFDIGLTLKLPTFTKQQVLDLAQRHGLDYTDADAERLMAMLGGHPYLVRLALYHLAGKGGMSGNLQQLLKQAPTEAGIYKDYLRQYVLVLREEPELAAAFYEVINAATRVKLEPVLAYKLQNMGLITLDKDCASPACDLYRLYFREQLKTRCDNNDARVFELEKENEQLRALSTLDELTQLPNRSYFKTYLQIEWLRCVRERTPLSLIFCDIDYLKFYNKTYGNSAGDICIQHIAATIRNCVTSPIGASGLSYFNKQTTHVHQPVFTTNRELGTQKTTDKGSIFIARYGGEEFVILAVSDIDTAYPIAEKIRSDIKNLAIPCDYPGIGGLPASVLTVSIGVASFVPQPEQEPETLILTAEKALQKAKRKGRDRVEVEWES